MTTIEKRIEIFENVRDIPYSLNIWNPEDVEKEQKGNCHAKSLYLRKLLEEEWYQIRNVTFPYKLRDFPDEVKYIPHQVDYHYALQIYLDKQWVTIDPTYDIWLAWSCFHVNNWDGVSSTLYCENPIWTIQYEWEKNMKLQNWYQEFCREMKEAYKKYDHLITKYSEQMEMYILSIRRDQKFIESLPNNPLS